METKNSKTDFTSLAASLEFPVSSFELNGNWKMETGNSKIDLTFLAASFESLVSNFEREQLTFGPVTASN
jgi:hypothetical protein